jgi:hypothetical protein
MERKREGERFNKKGKKRGDRGGEGERDVERKERR